MAHGEYAGYHRLLRPSDDSLKPSHEIANPSVQAPFEFGLAAGCAYFIYKLIRIWQQSTTTYQNVTISLTTFDALSVLSLGACFVGGVIVWCNFGKGLKQARELGAISNMPAWAGKTRLMADGSQ